LNKTWNYIFYDSKYRALPRLYETFVASIAYTSRTLTDTLNNTVLMYSCSIIVTENFPNFREANKRLYWWRHQVTMFDELWQILCFFRQSPTSFRHIFFYRIVLSHHLSILRLVLGDLFRKPICKSFNMGLCPLDINLLTIDLWHYQSTITWSYQILDTFAHLILLCNLLTNENWISSWYTFSLCHKWN
jgi:hypothetical protein